MAGGARLIAASADLAERGRGVRFTVQRGGRAVAAFAVRVDGVVRAYENLCAHEGVELDWAPGAFFDDTGEALVCASHGARYVPASGRCAGGPCRGRGLVPVAVVERDGGVYVPAGG